MEKVLEDIEGSSEELGNFVATFTELVETFTSLSDGAGSVLVAGPKPVTPVSSIKSSPVVFPPVPSVMNT